VAGLNAGVVGLLGAALYDPVFRHAVSGSADLALGVAAFAALLGGAPAWLVVVACGGAGALAA
jgi:chromate transporter